MKFIPILYSTPMVQAVIEDRKSQTRRTKGLEKINENPDDWQFDGKETRGLGSFSGNSPVISYFFVFRNAKTMSRLKFKCHYGQPGDVLWVRECFLKNPIGQTPFLYRADSNISKFLKWKPSIHMPKEAARLFLRIKDIRVERLRDIFHSDARAEGVDFVEGLSRNLYYNYLTLDYGCNELFSFMTLWQKINGEKSWGLNPWVWVIEFEKIEKPDGLC